MRCGLKATYLAYFGRSARSINSSFNDNWNSICAVNTNITTNNIVRGLGEKVCKKRIKTSVTDISGAL